MFKDILETIANATHIGLYLPYVWFAVTQVSIAETVLIAIEICVRKVYLLVDLWPGFVTEAVQFLCGS